MKQKVLTKEKLTELIKEKFESDIDILLIKGIVEIRDLSPAKETVKRKDAARVLHLILQKILCEQDLQDWSAALNLKDLYDCRICVNHIAQMYAKGILETLPDGTFGTEKEMGIDEFERALERLNDYSKRLKVGPVAKEFKTVSFDEYLTYKTEKSLSIDVRTSEEAQNPIRNIEMLNIPYEEIRKNPYIVSNDRNADIYLFCGMGYKSTMAAKLLCEAGYSDVKAVKPDNKD